MTETIKQRVNAVISLILGILDEDDIKGSDNIINDLGADTLDIAEIIMGIEEEFDIDVDIDDAGFKHFETVDGIIFYIEESLKV